MNHMTVSCIDITCIVRCTHCMDNAYRKLISVLFHILQQIHLTSFIHYSSLHWPSQLSFCTIVYLYLSCSPHPLCAHTHTHACLPQHTGEEYPAHSAAQLGNLQLLNMLIQEGHCTVNDRDKHNTTPAHKGQIGCCNLQCWLPYSAYSLLNEDGLHSSCLQICMML